MSTSAIVIASIIGMIVVMIGTVYFGLHFSKKSAEKRRLEEERKRLHEAESKNRRKF